ncbi:MAG: hypothetical protein C0412_05750 [Flavobacterium sp.]|nr:hypothetical protein [Flavobacterium sp.]
MLKKVMKMLALATFLALVGFNISIITDENGWSVKLVKDVFALPVPCIEGSPDWPNCNDGPGGNSGTGWKNGSESYACYCIMKQGSNYCYNTVWETQSWAECVNSGYEIAGTCTVGTKKNITPNIRCNSNDNSRSATQPVNTDPC